jgi:hypothetical protein
MSGGPLGAGYVRGFAAAHALPFMPPSKLALLGTLELPQQGAVRPIAPPQDSSGISWSHSVDRGISRNDCHSQAAKSVPRAPLWLAEQIRSVRDSPRRWCHPRFCSILRRLTNPIAARSALVSSLILASFEMVPDPTRRDAMKICIAASAI